MTVHRRDGRRSFRCVSTTTILARLFLEPDAARATSTPSRQISIHGIFRRRISPSVSTIDEQKQRGPTSRRSAR